MLNEFVAYLDLANGMATPGYLDPRSFLIAVYALCGFANLSSIAIQIGRHRRHGAAAQGRSVASGRVGDVRRHGRFADDGVRHRRFTLERRLKPQATVPSAPVILSAVRNERSRRIYWHDANRSEMVRRA